MSTIFHFNGLIITDQSFVLQTLLRITDETFSSIISTKVLEIIFLFIQTAAPDAKVTNTCVTLIVIIGANFAAQFTGAVNTAGISLWITVDTLFKQWFAIAFITSAYFAFVTVFFALFFLLFWQITCAAWISSENIKKFYFFIRMKKKKKLPRLCRPLLSIEW